jgi:hypothetical protein
MAAGKLSAPSTRPKNLHERAWLESIIAKTVLNGYPAGGDLSEGADMAAAHGEDGGYYGLVEIPR